MDSFRKDIGYAFRQLLKSPGFAIVAVISLALGIASASSVFSVIYGVLLNPYPYAHSERMVHLIVKTQSGADDWIELTGPEVRILRQARAVQSVAAQDDWDLITTGTDVPEDVQAVYLTANGMTHFGVRALLGRGFVSSDAPDGKDSQAVAVLSYRFWQRDYGGDPNVIGQRLELTHKPYAIVGVMPRRFTWGGGDGADVYLPLRLPEDPTRVFFPLILLGARSKP